MRPFLLLSSRAEDPAADGEYEAFLRFGGLPPERLRRIRMEAGPLPRLDLDDYAGIFVGGGPFNSSDPPAGKSAVQHRVERELWALLDEVVARDFPFFGACYGVGTLGVHQGGVIDRTYAEPISAVRIRLTEAGIA
ncbi:MAG TPA: glutamine amidotransferase, partial [Blastococcus sp.]